MRYRKRYFHSWFRRICLQVALLAALAAMIPGGVQAQGPAPGEGTCHLVYIELSDNNDRMGLAGELRTLIDGFTARGERFVTYLSNGENGRFFEGTDGESVLFNLVTDLNIGVPDAEYDLRRITRYWNGDDITRLDGEGRTLLRCRELRMHYFLSPSFYDLSGSHLTYKLLSVNNLEALSGNAGRVSQVVYFNDRDVDDRFMEYVVSQHREGFEGELPREFRTY